MDVLIVGSGAMAREVGAWLISRGRSVCWTTTSAERRVALEKVGRTALRRLDRADPALAATVRAEYCNPAQIDTPARLVIETTTEDLGTKRSAVSAVSAALGPGSILLTNSSSILPGAIHPRCVGMHFFAPVALSGVVEIVVERDRRTGLLDPVVAEAKALGLEYVVEDDRSAFAANRMLLGMQNEAARALHEGATTPQVNECSRIAGLPVGVLELVDRVGRKTVAAALAQYRSRMPARSAAELEPFARMLVAPEKPADSGTVSTDALRSRMLCALVGASLRFEADGLLSRADIDTLWLSALGAGLSLSQQLPGSGQGKLREQMRYLYENTGLSYFEPLGPLS